MVDNALLIVDMQVGNFSEHNPIYRENDLLEKVRDILAKARSANILIVFIKNRGGIGDPDEYETPGWEIHPSIAPHETEIVIEKTTPDSFHETSLLDVLESRGIKNLIVCGLQTEYCIDTTCRRGFSLGYNIILVQDAHSTWDSPILSANKIIDHHNDILEDFFVQLKLEDEIKF
jgi:nicotinamidase-related amidase